MIAVLSPAKTLDYETQRDDMPAATPLRFPTETNYLVTAARLKSVDELKKLMGISDALAELNRDRFANFDTLPTRQAIQAFDGDVYDGLDAKSLDADAILFAQDHLRILSGLYGMLRPLDAMKPYRLEMGTKRFPHDNKVSFWWEDRVAKLLAADAAETGNNTILNLASEEYWAVAKNKLPADLRVVKVDFMAKDGRFITFHAKVARGIMARWMIEHRVTNIDDMRGFDAAGYQFDAGSSTEDSWTCRNTDQ
jgi:cytoplasmic iron level regulating protein YaaA (DUF328/UPF0246 family)